MTPSNFIDLTGLKQHKLTVLRRDGYNKDGSRVMWLCQCECGDKVRISGHEIKRGQKSCKKCSKAQPTHLLSNLPEYGVWRNMIRRCTIKNDVSYFRYGARGIKVCDRWIGDNGMENFLADMGQRPDDTYTLERINNNGNYEPSNCKWATRTEQARNFRHNRILEWNGEKHCISEWAEILGVTHDHIWKRLNRGKSVDEVLSTAKIKPFHKIEYNGEIYSMKALERKLGLSSGALRHRIKTGLSLEEAIALGVGNGGYKHKIINNA